MRKKKLEDWQVRDAAVQSERVLNNDAYTESQRDIKDEIIVEWAGTKWFQWRKRESLWCQYLACAKMDEALAKRVKKHAIDSAVRAKLQQD